MPEETPQIEVRLDLSRELLKAESKVAGQDYVLGDPQPFRLIQTQGKHGLSSLSLSSRSSLSQFSRSVSCILR